MNLSRWSLHRLLAWWGTAMVLVLIVPGGIFSTIWITRQVERHLVDKGRFFGQAVAAGLVEPILTEDRVRAHELLAEAVTREPRVRYAAVVDGDGRVLAHSFEGGYPVALAQWWARQCEPFRYRSGREPLLDLTVPLPSPPSTWLHVGLLRTEAVRASRHVVTVLSLVATTALCLILIGARLVAVRVSRPLQRLEAAVSRYPDSADLVLGTDLGGTQEIARLAAGFGQMVARLEALEQERRRTQEALINAERLSAVGELAAGLAHEIRNPLDGMMECVRLLESDPAKSPKAQRYYPMLQDGLERIARTMQSMLELARSGQQAEVRSCRIAEVIEELRLLVEPQFSGRDAQITWEATGPCLCLCDRQGLLQACLNLLLNAVEAAGEGGRILVRSDCDVQTIRLVVADSGPGVPAAMRQRVFEPFVSTKPIGKGTGLGLSVSRQLIRAAGGDLLLEQTPSELGGACFVIRLPRDPECHCAEST